MSSERPAAYNPCTQQPKTLSDLKWWCHVERTRLFGGSREPISLDPPTLAVVDRLRAYSRANYGQQLWADSIDRMVGQYALDKHMPMADAEATALQVAADHLALRSGPEPAGRTRKARKTQSRRAPKKTRKRRSRTAELLLVFLEDRRNANLKVIELAELLQVHPSSISRAFRHPKHGPEILRRYRDYGIRPPGIHQI